MKRIELTHKGWFGLCPIYIGDAESDAPFLEPRFPLTGWLIDLSAGIYEAMNSESFPIMLTGELSPPRVITVED